MRVGLTGGIGSGKSTVAGMFEHHGAAVVDADAIARQVVERGSPVLARLVEEFGADIVDEDGDLRREELARRAFATERGTRHLNEITHPAIRDRAEEALAAAEMSSPSGIVIYEMPLLVETGQVSLVDVVIVVDVDEQTQIQRAVGRGLDESDVRARMGRQASRDERIAAADFVINNDDQIENTRVHVDAIWSEWMNR